MACFASAPRTAYAMTFLPAPQVSRRQYSPRAKPAARPGAEPARPLHLSWRTNAAPLGGPETPKSPSGSVPAAHNSKIWKSGDIVFLQYCPPKKSICWQYEPQESAYGHPALVLGTDDVNHHAEIMVISSLDSQSIMQKYGQGYGDREMLRAFFLISTSKNGDGTWSHPYADVPVLSLEGNGELKKVSYLRRDRVIKIEMEYLDELKGVSGKRLRMTTESVMKVVNMQDTHPIWPVFNNGFRCSSSGMPRGPRTVLTLPLYRNILSPEELERLKRRSGKKTLSAP